MRCLFIKNTMKDDMTTMYINHWGVGNELLDVFGRSVRQRSKFGKGMAY